MAIITLTTDFGNQDHYVGELKGSILGINPRAQLVDISHEIKPQDVRAASFVFSHAYRLFPKGTIHVVVVDPGVGSKRKIILAKTKDHFFIGPDNGVFTPIFDSEKNVTVREITNKKYFQKEVSATFHGRDIMGPTAAHLSKKNIMPHVGKPLAIPFRLKLAKPTWQKNSICAEILYIDRFGNLILNIKKKDLGKNKIRGLEYKKKQILGISETYAEAPRGSLLAVFGSSDYLEIAVNCGSCADRLGAKIGDRIIISV